MAKLEAFYATRDIYRNFTNYTEPLSFEEWTKRPDDHKVALLFVQFFSEITLAWEKANRFDFIEGEEGVTNALQYLQKQVCDTYIKGHPKKKVTREYFLEHPDECEERRIIDSDPAKFSSSYIYRVCYNSLYCICHDLKSVKDRWENETSPVVQYDGEELSVFDRYPDKHGSIEDVYEYQQFQKEFWSIIEDSGLSAEKVLVYLSSNDKADLQPMCKWSKKYDPNNPLHDVGVSLQEVDSILSSLRERFLNLPSDSMCGRYISRFQTVQEAC